MRLLLMACQAGVLEQQSIKLQFVRLRPMGLRRDTQNVEFLVARLEVFTPMRRFTSYAGHHASPTYGCAMLRYRISIAKHGGGGGS